MRLKVTTFLATRKLALMARIIDSDRLKCVITPTLHTIQTAFNEEGYEIRLCGGAVRDLIQGKTPKDLDFATTALPEEMLQMFGTRNWRTINANGLTHGTVTLRLDEENFEITTLRIDVVTDGRRAAVEYTKDWALDAERRDLTFNSLFLGLDGTLYDFFNGYDDLLNKRVRFVGSAETRIQEDYLRILRYFRFFGRIDPGLDGHDTETLNHIKMNASGLSIISGERIWSELRLIILGKLAPYIFQTMFDLKLLPYFGIPDRSPLKSFEEVYTRALPLDPWPITVLSSLFETEEEVLTFDKRVKFSRNERLTALFIVENKNKRFDLKSCQDLLVDSKDSANDPIYELLKYQGNKELLDQLHAWQVPKFPVSGFDLKSFGIPPGRQVGRVIGLLKDQWKQSGFLLNKDDLLSSVPGFAEQTKTP